MPARKQQRISLILFTVLFWLALPASAALLMHLPLDGNLNDSSGNGNNGVFQGGTTNPGYAPAIYDQGLNFDGNDDYITVPSFDPGSTFSASLWVNHDNIGTLNTFIEHVNNGDNRNDFYIGYDNSNNQLTVELEDNNQWEGGACGNPKFCTGIALSSNRWYFVVVTVTPTTLKVYVDATLAYSVTHTTTVNFGNGSWLLGGDTDNNPVTTANNDYLDGRLDDIRIYNNELTQTEISNLYGLVGEWDFDNCNVANTNDITDSSGNNLHASPINGVTTSATGKICTALTLDGTNDYAEVPDNNLLDITQTLTVMTWIRPNSIPNSGLMSILSKDTNYEFHINSSGRIFWWWNNSSGNTRSFTSTTAVSTNVWTHVAIVYKAGSQRIIINGVERGTRNYNETLFTNTNPLHFGGDQLFAGREFDGLIDEVKIYNRALTTEEINGYYTNPNPLNRTCTNCNSSTGCASDYGIYSSGNLQVDGSVTINGNAVPTYDGNVNSGINPATGALVNVTPAPTLPALNPATFEATTSSTNLNLTTDATVTGDYNNIRVRSGVNATFTGSTSYHINQLRVDNNATITLAPGNYFIDQLDMGNNSKLIINPSGKVNIFINNSFNTGNNVEINRYGNAADLTINLYSGAEFEPGNNAIFTGIVYSPFANAKVEFGNNSVIKGAIITNGSTELSSGTTITYGTAEQTAAAATVLCSTSSIDHFEISHDGTALTCEPESITIKSCANADCSSLYSTATTVNLTPTGWVGGDSKTVSGSSTFQLSKTTAGTYTLGISSSSPTSSNALVCKNTSTNSNSCDITFYDTGFIYDVPNLTSCATSANITVSAVRLDNTTQACVPTFQNKTRTLNFWNTYVNPNTGTASVILNNGTSNTTIANASPGTAVDLSFNASGQANVTVTYNDAGQLNLNSSYSSGTLTMTGSDSYINVPAKLYVYSNDTNAACVSNDGTCSAFKPAGSTTASQFNLKIRAACADNTVTPNFALNNIAISQTNTAPTIAQGNIAVTSFNMVAANNGEHTITNQAVSEVGSFTFTATSPTYLGVTGPVGTSTYIGRFYPHHFDTTVTQSCGSFSYSGQNISVTATAQNNWQATPTATQNYTGSFAYNTTLSNAGNTTNFSQNIIPAASFTNGTANKTDVLYTFAIKETVPLTIALRANDANTGGAIGVTEGTTEIRSGRTRVENAYGSELIDMAVPARVEFYNTNGFEINTADTCTTLDVTLSDIGTDPISLGTAAGQTCIWDDAGKSVGTTDYTCTADATKPQFSEPPSNGSFNIYLKAPGANNTGDIGVSLISPLWLQYDWDGNGTHDNNPKGTASFGLYRGDDRVIYWREIF